MFDMQKVKRHKVQLLLKHPFVGFFLKDLSFEITDSVDRAAIADTTILLNPKFMDTCSEAEQLTVCAHEVLHHIFYHLTRMHQVESKYPWMLMNRAADYIVNSTLVEMGLAPLDNVDGGWVYDPKYNREEWSFEAICEDLYKKREGEDEPKGPDDVRGEPTDKEGGTYSGEESKRTRGGRHGDDIIKVPKSPEEIEKAVRNIKRDLANAKKLAERTAGKIPGQFQKLIDQVLEPEVNWKQQLWDWATERSNDDTTWRRPNKKFIWQDIYLPSSDGEEIGNLCVVVDTSGSVSQKELEYFAGEFNSIREYLKPRLTTVIYCDAHVQKVEEYEPDDEVKFEMIGGGGTDFRPPFDYLDNNAQDVVGLVYMTDMWGQFPDTPPEYPVAWLSTSGVDKAPFGKVICAKFGE